MSKATSTESSKYAELGASSSKEEVHKALKHTGTASYFAELGEDVCGDANYYSLLHADGAGTKSIVAYICYKETGDATWFRSLAQDSLVMNLDDIACVNAFESLSLSNTIGRNRFLINDSAIKEIIEGYKEQVAALKELGIDIQMSGGETADLGDLVRTLVIDSTLFARVKKSEVISTDSICAGDIIIGLSSTGKASYEQEENSGIASNGFTMARHALISQSYLRKYPEIADPTLDPSKAYQGQWDIFDSPAPLNMSIAKALISPTRTYAPIIKKITKQCGQDIHGLIHCTGGGQTKVLRFGKNKKYIKDNLFPCPAIFSLIQKTLNVPWEEMYSVFNMGHRIEVICPENCLKSICDISAEYDIKAQQIGHVEEAKKHNTLSITSPNGHYEYN